ncbi:MAG: zinc ABC transporter substrate-binding protein [Erysipelotrichaceae bacterium]|nr:zinc ABC transporter substrate-binding protein [Erysipelotrichaceae bacterium]
MRYIKKIITILMILVLFTACGEKKKQEEDRKISVVTTIFPFYDWCRQLTAGAENIVLTQVVSSSSDLHSYQPTAKDIMSIAEADIFIYGGGESDEWAKDVVDRSGNETLLSMNLLEELGSSALEEEIKEGMEADHDHEHEEEHEHEEGEYDEHVWLSLKNAGLFVEKICTALCEKDPENKAVYENNRDAYLKKLSDLDVSFAEAAASKNKDILLFADRFPFLYLCKDYGLDYYAAFNGCSAETEASFETIRFLAEKTKEHSLNVILTIEDGNVKIAETVKDNAGNEDIVILSMNSMQSGLTENDDYLSLMEKNLEVLKQALQ